MPICLLSDALHSRLRNTSLKAHSNSFHRPRNIMHCEVNDCHCHCPVDYVLENWPTGIFNLYSKLHYGSLCWLYLEWCLICNYIYICILEYLQHDKFCAGDFWSQTIVIWNVKQKMNGFGMPLPLSLSLPCHCQRN